MTIEGIKQICQIYDNLRAERDAATIAYNSEDTFWGHVLATYKLYQPSLPSNIDEAAETFAHNGDVNGVGGDDYEDDLRITFKSGAEWLADQGASYNTEVGWIDGPTVLDWPDNILDGFKMGDKVVVQIRKK